MSNTPLNPETLKAIEQEAGRIANFSNNDGVYEHHFKQGKQTGYLTCATYYALRLQQVEQENERLRKSLGEIQLMYWGDGEPCELFERIKTIATEALKQP